MQIRISWPENKYKTSNKLKTMSVNERKSNSSNEFIIIIITHLLMLLELFSIYWDLDTLLLRTAHCFMTVNICVKLFYIEGVMDQTSCFMLIYRIIWPWPLSYHWVTNMGLRHDTSAKGNTHLCQVISKSIPSYGTDKLFYHIRPWGVTLTLDLATQS